MGIVIPRFTGWRILFEAVILSRRERDGCGCASGSIVPFATGVFDQALSRVLRDMAE